MKQRLAVGAVILGALAGVLFFWFGYAPAAAVPPLLGALEPLTVTVGGTSRHALRYAPAHLEPDAPLLIVFHGTGQDGAAMRASTAFEFDALADRFGFSVLYPDGLGRQWNDCRPKAAGAAAVDDVAFVDALLAAEGRPAAKVYLFGYSNGGQMALRLVTEQPARFAGAAVTGANLPTPEFFHCPTTGPTAPLLFANGTADPIVPFEGGQVTIFHVVDRGQALSAGATAQAFAARNGLGGPADDAPGERTVRHRWLREGRPWIEQLVFEGGGHVIPQPHYRFPRLVGPTPTFDLPREAVDFFGLPLRSAR